VRVLTEDGRVLLDSAGTEEEPRESPYLSAEGRRGLAKRVGERFLDENEPLTEDALRVAAPVTLADGRAGRVELSRPLRSVNAFIWAEREKLAFMSLAVAGAMLIAGWLLATRLTRSVDRLTDYVRQVRDGRKVVPPRSRAKELAILAAAFEEMRDTLEGRQHAERYTQVLAHEVKAPLAAIRGAAELLQEDLPAEARQKFLGNIRSESARIQQLIERLLELSSLEARKSLQTLETIDAGELATEAVAAVQAMAEARGVRLVRTAVAGPTVRGERVLLREAIVNLLQNAIDFSPVSGETRIGVTVAGDRIHFWVEDDGPGVPDYALPKVFDRFYSLPRPGGSRKSTGLGLTLVREIAHLHGGECALENRAGGGARARFWLPRETARG
jgi:two-component system sensor histidine kinase CreC